MRGCTSATFRLCVFVLPSIGEKACVMKEDLSLLKNLRVVLFLNQWQGIDLQFNEHQEGSTGLILWRKE